jgi:cell division protein ZapA (FtsZ GTPase activity inhibitor)
VALHLLDDHIRALSKRLPTLYRRRVLVLLSLLALHLFIVTPFVRLSTDEQRYQSEAASLATRIRHLQAVETDVHRALDQVDRQKTLLLDDLVARFKKLSDVRDEFASPTEDRPEDIPFQSEHQIQGMPGQEPKGNTALAEAVAKAENTGDKATAYRVLIQHLILEPAFSQANQRWQDEKTAIEAGLKRIRDGLPAAETFRGIEELLTRIDDEVRRYRFTAPEGDWWMTVSGKEAVLDRNLDRIAGTLKEAILPLAADRDKLRQEIDQKRARLEEARREKEALAARAAKSFLQIEDSLNIAVIDGAQAIALFPALLALALGLMTADICRCLQELTHGKKQVDAGLQTKIAQWLAMVARPPYLLDFIMALWIFLAVLHVRPLNADSTLYAGQILFGALVLATVTTWEGVARRRAMAEMPVDAGTQAPVTNRSEGQEA